MDLNICVLADPDIVDTGSTVSLADGSDFDSQGSDTAGRAYLAAADIDGGVSGGTEKEQMDSKVEYAYRITDKCVEYLKQGVVAPFSSGEKVCEGCKYSAICDGVRKIRLDMKAGKIDAPLSL